MTRIPRGLDQRLDGHPEILERINELNHLTAQINGVLSERAGHPALLQEAKAADEQHAAEAMRAGKPLPKAAETAKTQAAIEENTRRQGALERAHQAALADFLDALAASRDQLIREAEARKAAARKTLGALITQVDQAARDILIASEDAGFFADPRNARVVDPKVPALRAYEQGIRGWDQMLDAMRQLADGPPPPTLNPKQRPLRRVDGLNAA
ncbi:MAG: hypothetical protein U0R70_06415 [Solirubrobacteraceae bacterium]